MSACGFTLRGTQTLPETYKEVYIASDYKYAPLQRAIAQRLPVYQLQPTILNAGELGNVVQEDAVAIILQPEKLDRRLLSVFSTGQVAEYELIYTVEYRVIFSDLPEVKGSLSVSREYQDDPDEVLAKSRELELVLNEMRLDSADRIIRLLSYQYRQAVLEQENE